MNTHIPSTQAADPLAPRGSMSCQIDMQKLRSMDMQQIYDLRDALHTSVEVICGLSCQGRFAHETKESVANSAGEILCDIIEWLNAYEQAVVNVASAAEPTDARNAACKALTLISFEASFNENLLDLASIANSEVGKALPFQKESGR